MGWVANTTPDVQAQSKWVTILAVCICLSALSTVTVCYRLCIRRTSSGLAADDYISASSMIFSIAYSTLCVVQTRYGLGLPLKLRPLASAGVYTRVNFAGRPIYQLGVSLFKIALLVSYLRLLRGTNHSAYRIVIGYTIVVVFLAHLGCALSMVFACTPIEKSWSPQIAGDCLQPGPSFTSYAVVTITSDIIVAALPVPILSRLNMRLEKKLALVAIFMLGLFTTVCSVFRYLQIHRIQNGDGDSTMLVLWGTIEFNVGNVVSSLPFLASICVECVRRGRVKPSSDRGLRGIHGESVPVCDQCGPDDVDNCRDGDGLVQRVGSDEEMLEKAVGR